MRTSQGTHLALKGRTGEEMTSDKTAVFVFSDRLRTTLLANIEVVMHAMSTVFLKTKIREVTHHTLSMPLTKRARNVRIFSNKPNLVQQVTSDRGKVLPLLPGQSNHVIVKVSAEAAEDLVGETLVHCVDCNSSEIVHSWLLKIETL